MNGLISRAFGFTAAVLTTASRIARCYQVAFAAAQRATETTKDQP